MLFVILLVQTSQVAIWENWSQRMSTDNSWERLPSTVTWKCCILSPLDTHHLIGIWKVLSLAAITLKLCLMQHFSNLLDFRTFLQKNKSRDTDVSWSSWGNIMFRMKWISFKNLSCVSRWRRYFLLVLKYSNRVSVTRWIFSCHQTQATSKGHCFLELLPGPLPAAAAGSTRGCPFWRPEPLGATSRHSQRRARAFEFNHLWYSKQIWNLFQKAHN